MKIKRKIIEIDEEKCDGCGQCIPSCAEGAIQIIDGKARVVSDKYCDGLGACLGECPNDALHLVEREAEEFDPEAVETYLETLEKEKGRDPGEHTHTQPQSPCSHVHTLKMTEQSRVQWPVKLQLIPDTAPFLKDAHLALIADCSALCHPGIRDTLCKGKAIMMGCPKFNDPEAYVEKLVSVFRKNNIRSVLVVEMEVPCCSAMKTIAEKAVSLSGKAIPVSEVVLKTDGTETECTPDSGALRRETAPGAHAGERKKAFPDSIIS